MMKPFSFGFFFSDNPPNGGALYYFSSHGIYFLGLGNLNIFLLKLKRIGQKVWAHKVGKDATPSKLDQHHNETHLERRYLFSIHKVAA